MNNSNKGREPVLAASFRQKVYPFFWFVAAADGELLKRCPIPEQDKIAGTGMAIICTTIAAMLSCFYAIFTLFGNVISALLVSFFWGLIIFNLDRFMIGSMKKSKQRDVLAELKIATPRIVLALFIALLISKPLEVKIFENQIEQEGINFSDSLLKSSMADISNNYDRRNNEFHSSTAAADNAESDVNKVQDYRPYILSSSEYSTCKNEALKIQGEITLKYARRRKLISIGNQVSAAQVSYEIKGLRSRIESLGCSEKKSAMDRIEKEFIQSRLEKAKILRHIKDSLSIILNEEGKYKEEQEKYRHSKIDKTKDILGRLRILYSLQKKDPAMMWAGLLITLLFFILEIAPIMVKIMSPRGEYDSLLSIAVLQAMDREDAAEEESRQELKARRQAAAQNTIGVAEVDEKVKKRVQERIMQVQANLAEKIIDAWQAQQLTELESDKNEYLKKVIS